MKISTPKHLQFSSSQQIKEVHPCQFTPSPTDDGQRNRPLRGLDFLLSPFLVSRQEKEKEIQEKHLQFSSSQNIKEANSRQNTPSPTDNGQRKRHDFDSFGIWYAHSWGVCHTPLPWRTKNRHDFDSFTAQQPQNRPDFDSPTKNDP